jgi:small subunit ribosomal protein S3
VIGRRGSRIKEISRTIEEEFEYDNPSVSVVEIEKPELEPRIMVSQVTRSLARGYRYRRVGFWVLRSIMEAGAAGAEIVISGKLRTVRSRYEKFSAGVLLKSGDLAQKLVKRAQDSVTLKQGKVGVKVSVAPSSPEYEEAIGKRPEEPASVAASGEAQT